MKASEWLSAPAEQVVTQPEPTQPEPSSAERHLGMALGILKEIEPLGDSARDLRVFCEEWARQAREGTAEEWIAPKRVMLGKMIDSLGVLYARPLEGHELRAAIVDEIKALRRRSMLG